MMIALNRGGEFEMDVRAALEHGIAPELIKEVICKGPSFAVFPLPTPRSRRAGKIIDSLKGA